MSQAKVDKYKEYKKNRRENIKKEKRKAFLGRLAAWSVVVVFVVGVGTAIGVSIYNHYQAKLAAMPTYASTGFMVNDYAGIQNADKSDDSEIVVETETEVETEAEVETQTEVETEAETETSEAVSEVSETEEETKE